MKLWHLFFLILACYDFYQSLFVKAANKQGIELNNLKKKETDRLWYEEKKQKHETAILHESRYHVLRLGPGEDLLQSLWKYARVTGIKAASIVSTVGSLQKTNIRYANQPDGTSVEDYFEIVSLVGNIDYQSNENLEYPSSMGTKEGSGHVHISLSDKTGNTIGGHLLEGNIIYTTAEITLVELVDGLFTREIDNTEDGGSGYYELKVYEEKSGAEIHV